ncbi:MAG: phosphatidylserine decarboxylase [Gemmatimonadetes bacterium]|jgi:phosphatidylserine decarboxylase|nr:phosphatidylserine decarboxylase [Gemmatimonadota bacterium]
MKRDALTYFHRSRGELAQDNVYARGLLDWCYNTRIGRWLTRNVLRRRWVSQVYGWVHRLPISRRRIQHVARDWNIDTEDLLQPLAQYASFNDFFTREIDLRRRPIHPDPQVCVAPADARVLAYPVVDADTTFRIKCASFRLARFLGDRQLTAMFAGGAMCIHRLYLSDYHRFHFPVDGIPEQCVDIPGYYDAVSPYSQQRLVPFYAENHRVRTLLQTARFGPVLMVEVGAFTVGSIRQCYQPGQAATRGECKGLFELGGSTVVLLFAPGVIRFDDDLLAHTRDELETYVQLGDRLGQAIQS